ncbi:transketolase C-terminal domain-containing protein, partial [uncultured Negativibacillus sp.]|uniref:transketolase C-terminal domain-containing protein n=2 Tax=Bacillota TaxID=1239 RepID=UPI0025F1CCF4
FDPKADWQLFGEEQAPVVLVTYGRICSEVISAMELLQQQGISAAVIKLGRILPLPQQAVQAALKAQDVFFVEEGIKNGGIGQLFGQALLEQDYKGRYRIAAVDNRFIEQATVARATTLAGLDANGIADSCLRWLG